jgi:hypothetical protein
MHIPARILRSWVEDAHGRPPPSTKELDREEAILTKARTLLLRAGRHGVSLSTMGLALRMAPSTIRMAFCDLDNILFELLWRHLEKIYGAVLAIPDDSPDCTAARLTAYLQIARVGMGGLSGSHRLLVRDRHALPPDLAEPIEDIRRQIGEKIAGRDGELALNMLDTPWVEPHRLVAMLQALAAAPDAPAQAEPEDRPQAEPEDIPAATRNFRLSNSCNVDFSSPSSKPENIEAFLEECEAAERYPKPWPPKPPPKTPRPADS